MPTSTSTFNTYGRLHLEGSVDLSAAGAVSATRGDGFSVAKTGTGAYAATWKNNEAFVMNEVIGSMATLRDTAVGTVKDVGVISVTQSANGDIVIAFRTVAADGSNADEATNALTVDFSAVLRTRDMGGY